MAIKLDLEKAYDRLEWPFIKSTLELYQFPPCLISLIMNMVSSVSYSLKWNGQKIPSFRPSTGIRQGDPFSPFLFILCLNRLSLQLDSASTHLFHPLKVRSNYSSSHLFFADDIFLFTKASRRDCQAIYSLLQNFCEVSSQLISLQKSKILFSPKIPRLTRTTLQGMLNITQSQSLGLYLGAPIFVGCRSSQEG